MAKRESPFAPGIRAIKASWPAMVAIQICLLLVLLGFFFVPSVTSFLNWLAVYKDQAGVFSAVIAGFVSGGFLPEIAKLVSGKLKKVDSLWFKQTFYNGVVYSIISICVYFLYKFLDGVFGPTTNAFILAEKVLFDQLIFSPFLSIPLAFHLFGWRDAGYKNTYAKNLLNLKFYVKHVWPPLVMCWAFWGPAVTCIYIFPERVQFVLSFMCQGAWSLIFVLMVKDSGLSTAEEFAIVE